MREKSPATNITEAHEFAEKLVVRKIYQFMHPDYDSYYHGSGEQRRRHKDLQKLWQEKIEAIAKEPGAVLFYVTAFFRSHFGALARSKNVGEDLGKSKALERDLQRIKEAKKLLGNRCVLLFNQSFDIASMRTEDLEGALRRRGIVIDRKNPPRFECFGEYLHMCVSDQAGLLLRLLGLPYDLQYYEESGGARTELSLAIEDSDTYQDLKKLKR